MSVFCTITLFPRLYNARQGIRNLLSIPDGLLFYMIAIAKATLIIEELLNAAFTLNYGKSYGIKC